jgi:hypothetical protein
MNQTTHNRLRKLESARRRGLADLSDAELDEQIVTRLTMLSDHLGGIDAVRSIFAPYPRPFLDDYFSRIEAVA